MIGLVSDKRFSIRRLYAGPHRGLRCQGSLLLLFVMCALYARRDSAALAFADLTDVEFRGIVRLLIIHCRLKLTFGANVRSNLWTTTGEKCTTDLIRSSKFRVVSQEN